MSTLYKSIMYSRVHHNVFTSTLCLNEYKSIMYSRVHSIASYLHMYSYYGTLQYTNKLKELIMANYIKVYELDVLEVVLHDLVHLTPQMTKEDYAGLKASIKNNGQEEPIVMYRGKCIDGRHRLKALADLGIIKVKAVNEQSNLSESDIVNKVLNVFERRRHQTPTQKCISALKQYNMLVLAGEKPAKGTVAEQAGISRNSLYLAEQLLNVCGTDVVEHLFNGNKLNIGTDTKPIVTDSLKQIINYYKSRTADLLELSNSTTTTTSDYTEEEIALVNSLIDLAKAQLPGRLLNLYKQRAFTLE